MLFVEVCVIRNVDELEALSPQSHLVALRQPFCFRASDAHQPRLAKLINCLWMDREVCVDRVIVDLQCLFDKSLIDYGGVRVRCEDLLRVGGDEGRKARRCDKEG
jgi:hypothetical protein